MSAQEQYVPLEEAGAIGKGKRLFLRSTLTAIVAAPESHPHLLSLHSHHPHGRPAHRFDEALVLGVAAALEDATEYHRARPAEG